MKMSNSTKVEYNEKNIDRLSEKMTEIVSDDVLYRERRTWTDELEEYFYSSYVEFYKNDKEAFYEDWEAHRIASRQMLLRVVKGVEDE